MEITFCLRGQLSYCDRLDIVYSLWGGPHFAVRQLLVVGGGNIEEYFL